MLRRNLRIANSTKARRAARPFAASTFGSHHTGLVNANNTQWNALLELGTRRRKNDGLLPRPVLGDVDSNESFGLVRSPSVIEAFNKATDVKPEDVDLVLSGEALDDDDADGSEDGWDQDEILREMGVDPAAGLTLVPERPSASAACRTPHIPSPPLRATSPLATSSASRSSPEHRSVSANVIGPVAACTEDAGHPAESVASAIEVIARSVLLSYFNRVLMLLSPRILPT